MSLVVDPLPWNAAGLTALQAQSAAHHHASLRRFQQQGLERFLQTDFPTSKDEAWKYTSLKFMQDQTYLMPGARQKTSIALPSMIANAIRIVFVDGHFAPELSQLSELSGGVVVANLLDQIRDTTELVLSDEYATPFSDLNAALMGDGFYLRVSKEEALERPIHLIYHQTAHASSLMSHPRHLVVIEAGAKASIVEEYSGCPSTYFNNVVTRIIVEEESQLTFYKLQDEGEQALHIANTTVTQHKNSLLRYVTLSLGAKFSRDNLNVDLHATGAECELYGLYLPRNSQVIDHHTRIDHRVPHGTSTQSYKGIIADKARGVFNGKVCVFKDAVKTAASQSNKNLLLSSSAEIDTKPELEIYADDVKCAHGATVGQLDQQALFFLRSRGLDSQAALQLLMHAFAQEVFDHFSDPSVAAYFSARLARHLEALSCSR